MMSLSCRVEIRREWIEDSGVAGSVAWTIDKVEGIEITGDGDSLQDTCTIKLPKNARWGVSGSEIPVRRGDMVRVWLGYDGEIKIVSEEGSGKLVWECPNCGNRNQDLMSVARRTCGYIGTQFWNQGRTQEIQERVLHL